MMKPKNNGLIKPMHTSPKPAPARPSSSTGGVGRPSMKRAMTQPPDHAHEVGDDGEEEKHDGGGDDAGCDQLLGSDPCPGRAWRRSARSLSWSPVRWPCRMALRPATINAGQHRPQLAHHRERHQLPGQRQSRTAAGCSRFAGPARAPVKKPVSTTIGSDPTPIRSALHHRVRKVARLGEEVAD